MKIHLATRLVEEWATDRCTQPEPAERDLARWIVDRLDPSFKRAVEEYAEQKRTQDGAG